MLLQYGPTAATLHRQGCKYVWCTTCAKWMYHKADKYDAWQARAAARIAAGLAPGAPLPAAAATPPNPVASLAAVTPMDEDDWLFYGGRRLLHLRRRSDVSMALDCTLLRNLAIERSLISLICSVRGTLLNFPHAQRNNIRPQTTHQAGLQPAINTSLPYHTGTASLPTLSC
jgi:hypothetical protein